MTIPRAALSLVLLALQLLLIAGPLLTEPASAAQTGRVAGVVQDPNGAAIAGARVSLTNSAGEVVGETSTGTDGRFEFANVEDGRFTINVEAEGFSLSDPVSVQIRNGGRATPTIKLEVSRITETITVSGVDPIYRELRETKLGSDYADVANLILKRDQATITFVKGQFFFLPPVEGKITGAVFQGEGQFSLSPLLTIEQRHLSYLTGSGSMSEQFSRMVLRFTDSTFDEIKSRFEIKQGTPNSSAADAYNDIKNDLRRSRSIRYNIDARLLMDLLSGSSGLFQAFFDGQKYGKLIYVIDPLGVPQVAPEEVALFGYDQGNRGTWNAAHLKDHYTNRSLSFFDEDHTLIDMVSHKIDVTLKGKRLDGKSQETFIARADGTRVFPLTIFAKLRVEKVTDGAGRELKFIQEESFEDADLYVILPEGMKKGQTYTLNFEYAGNDAVADSGGGNFTLTRRTNWFPNNGHFGDRATYEITLRVPKGLTTVASGRLESEATEGDVSVTRWKSDVPLSVAGFNYGKFKKTSTEEPKTKYVIETFANTELPDFLRVPIFSGSVPGGDNLRPASTLEGMDTTSLMKKASAEAQLSIDLFSSLYGELPYGE